jgi:hypothetical protein
VTLSGGRGEARVSAPELRLKNATIGDSFLPLEYFSSARAALTFEGNRVATASLRLDGKGISARIRGGGPGDRSGAVLEVMTEASFGQFALLDAAMNRYLVSPGYYSVPVGAGP